MCFVTGGSYADENRSRPYRRASPLFTCPGQCSALHRRSWLPFLLVVGVVGVDGYSGLEPPPGLLAHGDSPARTMDETLDWLMPKRSPT